MACPLRVLVALYRVDISTQYEMINVWNTVSALNDLSRKSQSTDYHSPKRIGQIIMDLLYIKFTYQTKYNEQEWYRLSNHFSLRCLGPWMNHLPTVHF